MMTSIENTYVLPILYVVWRPGYWTHIAGELPIPKVVPAAHFLAVQSEHCFVIFTYQSELVSVVVAIVHFSHFQN